MARQALSIPKLIERIPDDTAAYLFLEEMRWKGRPVCPHCASVGGHYFLQPRGEGQRKTRTGAGTVRRVWKCCECRKQFSVLTGTIMHRTKISVRTWVFVLFEVASSKNGISAREVARKYEITDEAAWFMCHRIREAMKRDPDMDLMSGVVVADETFIGGKPSNRHGHKKGKGWPVTGTDKTPVFALISKQTGEVRSHVIPKVNGRNLRVVMEKQVDLPRTTLHTDTGTHYKHFKTEVAEWESVDHSAHEYVRGEVSTNLAESYFAQLKRSIDGTHHNVSVEHLPRYLAEFDFRFSTREITDADRMARIIGQVAGRRLMYSDSAA